MSVFSSLFNTKRKQADADFTNPITTELHSHLIPEIDDGVETLEQSLAILKTFAELGYKKVITTPHIMSDFYPNSAHNILPGLEKVRTALQANHIDIELHAAAEYMVDELLEEKIEKGEILSFGNNCVLIELPFQTEPSQFKHVLFSLQMHDYQPVLAHPERYGYFAHRKERLEELVDAGVWLQLNLFSLVGYYSPAVQKTAEYLIEKKLVHLVGSDIHTPKHLPVLHNALASYNYQKLCELSLKNNLL